METAVAAPTPGWAQGKAAGGVRGGVGGLSSVERSTFKQRGMETPLAAPTPDRVQGKAAPTPGRAPGKAVGGVSGGVCGLYNDEWSTFKQRGRKILRRATDQKGCLRRLREKADAFLKMDSFAAKSKGEGRQILPGQTEAEISVSDLARIDQIQVSYGQSEESVSSKINSKFVSVGIGDYAGLILSANSVSMREKFVVSREYLREGNQGELYQFWMYSVPLPPVSALCPLCVKQEPMATSRETEMDLDGGAMSTGTNLGAPVMGSDGAVVAVGAASAATSAPASADAVAREKTNTPMLEKRKATVGGPAGLAITTTPKTVVGFTAAVAPPQLRRYGKIKEASSSRAPNKPIVINLEAALRAVAGKLVVGRVLSPYPVDPKMVVNELRGPWRLRGDAVAQRVTSEDRRFIITFKEEGDRSHVLHAGPWHFRDDVVVLAAFDGRGNPEDVPLDSIKIWVQIWGLPVPLKTVEMGKVMGDKLGKVVAVSHKDKMIVDEHLRVRAEHRVEEPLRKVIDTVETMLDGNTKEVLYDVKYEKLPRFCFCCGVLGHTTASFCSIPKEL
ncbi:hypothetical protein VPH35_020218 [Triticum aestivum]